MVVGVFGQNGQRVTRSVEGAARQDPGSVITPHQLLGEQIV